MKEFRRNKETGILEVWENEKKVGEVRTMGDEIINTGAEKRRRKRNEDRGKR